MLTQCRSPGACLCVKLLHLKIGDSLAPLQNAPARGTREKARHRRHDNNPSLARRANGNGLTNR